MLEDLLKRLRNVLEEEQRQNWRGEAVIGGFEKFRRIWHTDAIEAGLDAPWVEAVSQRLQRYESADRAARPHIARQILELLNRGQRAPSQGHGRTDAALRNIDRLDGSSQPQPARPSATRSSSPVPPAGPTPARPDSGARSSTKENQEETILDAGIEKLKGIGPATAKRLRRLNINTVEDLIWHLPHRHDDYSRQRKIGDMLPGEKYATVAILRKIKQRKLAFKRGIVQGIFDDGSGTLRATWWNQAWMADKLTVGRTYRLMGKVDLYMGHKTINNPEWERLAPKALDRATILPVYPLTEGITSNRLSRLVQKALKTALPALQDPVPDAIREAHGLMDLAEALKQIHCPESLEELDASRRRLAFDELFYIQLGVQRRRHLLQKISAPALAFNSEILNTFTSSLPFELTDAQARVLKEIALDIARGVPMSRLVQGDVGSGKTVVAAGAMYVAACNGTQSALLAPTQILAEQHFRGLTDLFDGLVKPGGAPLRIELLTGRVRAEPRQQIMEGLATGEIDIVVGTTALIQDEVAFDNLAFVVVDEQHRFGVEQRGSLRSKGNGADDSVDGQATGQASLVPHMLVMSATPIPRSLALTIYGDLDVSIVDEMPPGRQTIKTKLFQPPERERLYSFIRREALQGRQSYIIYPLVEESDKLDAGAAVAEHERLQTVFPDLRLGLLHGRLGGSEKDDVMQRFAAGELDILVSTSVIEVGIDVPNATVMLIEDAHRFGLAQLHQLRGRVGRGEHQSYCALISPMESETAEERLTALEETTDGFELAEKDLALRGPGEFLGTRQSGLPNLRMAQLSDIETLSLAQQAARQLYEQDPDLDQHPILFSKVEQFWRGHGDVS